MVEPGGEKEETTAEPTREPAELAASASAPAPPARSPWKRRLGCMAVFLVLFLAFLGPWPVNSADPLASEDGKKALETAREVGSLLQNPSGGTLLAGWAVVKLPLSVGTPLAGYGKRQGNGATGVLDPLFARALCLDVGGDPVVVVTADMLLVNRDLATRVHARVAAERDLPRERLVFTSTHTHCGPGAWSTSIGERLVAGAYDPVVVEGLTSAMSQAVLQSIRTRGPAEAGWVRTEAREHIRNRTVSGGPVDADLDALVVRKQGGKLGLLAIYGAHATCLGPEEMRFSADYPGALVAALEEDGFDFAAFAAGAVGSHAPSGEGKDEARADSMGRALAQKLAALARRARLESGATLAVCRRTIPLPPIQIRISKNLRISNVLARTQHDATTEIQALRLGNHLLIASSFELSGMVATGLKEKARAAGLSLHITCFNGDYTGYVLPDAYYDEDVYEAWMSFLGPKAGSFVEGVFGAIVEGAKNR